MSILDTKRKVNYRVYNFLYNTKNYILRKTPNCLVSKRRGLGQRLEIGITTYIDRYDMFFKPLYRQIMQLFPEVSIRIVVNGFYDEFEQKEYLKRIESELCYELDDRVTFVLHDKPKGLTRLWNEILVQNTTEYTLLLNDDLEVFPWFRRWIETAQWENNYITLLEGTWSHFLIGRKCLDDIGWFDEEFQGFGFEDMDYTARCLASNLNIGNIRCPFLRHSNHRPVRTSFDKKSSIEWEKYSSINQDYFFKKWKLCSYTNSIYIKQLSACVEPTGYSGRIIRPTELSFDRGICYPDRAIS